MLFFYAASLKCSYFSWCHHALHAHTTNYQPAAISRFTHFLIKIFVAFGALFIVRLEIFQVQGGGLHESTLQDTWMSLGYQVKQISKSRHWTHSLIFELKKVGQKFILLPELCTTKAKIQPAKLYFLFSPILAFWGGVIRGRKIEIYCDYQHCIIIFYTTAYFIQFWWWYVRFQKAIKGSYAGRRTDFWDQKSSDFSGEIFLERFFWSSITARATLQ